MTHRHGAGRAETTPATRLARAAGGEIPGCRRIADCPPRSRARVAGVVGSIRLVPRAETTRLEITISDGSGEISGVWFGRSKISGLNLGERVVFEGMIGSPVGDKAGARKEILHPSYQLLGG